MPNFYQSYTSVVPYQQHEQGHQDPYPVCIFAQF